MGNKKSRQIADQIVAGFKDLSKSLAEGGPVADKFTCRRVTLDIQLIPYPPKEVRATRLLLRVSQPVFAHFLGVSPAAIKSWEQGRQQPPDIACRFMDEIQRDPDHWRKRLWSSIRVKAM